MWPFRKKANDALLERYQNLERMRLDKQTELEIARLDLDKRRTELEFEHLEAQTKREIALAQAKEELRAVRQRNAQKARERRNELRGQTYPGSPQVVLPNQRCRPCVAPNTPDLTADEIRWHHAGHPASWMQNGAA